MPITDAITNSMILLKRFNGKTLLPSPEEFDFSLWFSKGVNCKDFLNYPIDYQFKTIVGIISYDKIKKCINHLDFKGELIIGTNNFELETKLYHEGTITDIIHFDKVIVLRFNKDDFSHQTLIDGKWHNYTIKNNHLYFSLPL